MSTQPLLLSHDEASNIYNAMCYVNAFNASAFATRFKRGRVGEEQMVEFAFLELGASPHIAIEVVNNVGGSARPTFSEVYATQQEFAQAYGLL